MNSTGLNFHEEVTATVSEIGGKSYASDLDRLSLVLSTTMEELDGLLKSDEPQPIAVIRAMKEPQRRPRIHADIREARRVAAQRFRARKRREKLKAERKLLAQMKMWEMQNPPQLPAVVPVVSDLDVIVGHEPPTAYQRSLQSKRF